MRRVWASGLAALALFGLVAGPAAAWACVGKTLYLGRLPGKEQEILAEIFTWLVSERTGTSVEVRAYPDSRASHSALEKAKIDLYLEETGVALCEILGREAPAGGAEEARQLVRKEYEERFNFIWLEPWGLAGKFPRDGSGNGDLVSLVAPVVRKDTLKKFPALSRLINKLAGVMDNETMARLLAESAHESPREVTKKFLKQKKLI